MSGFALDDGCTEGLSLASLQPGTTVIVRTRNSRYRLIVLEGGHRILIQGGVMFPEPTPVRFQGANAGGSMLKTGWIGIGLRLEFQAGFERIVTSRVLSVSIESLPPTSTDLRNDF